MTTDEPTALERIRPLIESGAIRCCRSSKPLTEHDALLILEFRDALAAGTYAKTDQQQPDQEDR